LGNWKIGGSVMGFRIVTPSTASEVGKPAIQKRPRQKDDKHLAFIRTLPSVVSGQYGCDPAHIRMGNPSWGKRETGKGEKSGDMWVVPLTRSQHDEQHLGSEAEYWSRVHIDPFKVAAALWIHSGETETCEIILREARK
jgi:hypothetical protein